MTKQNEVVKGFKGFNQDWTCNKFQFKPGETYSHKGEVKACESGFHFCESPMDVFGYYAPATSRFAEVEGSGKIDRKGDDSKVSCETIKIGAEISLSAYIDAAVKFVFERAKKTNHTENKDEKKIASNSGYKGAASNSGYKGAASNSGDYGAASNSGDYGAASNSGYKGAASNSGYKGAASNSGSQGAASNSGYQGAASNSGDYGAASNSGYKGAASNSGDYGAASNSGDYGAASNSGYKGAASNSGSQGAASNSGSHGAASNSGYKGAASNSGDYGAASNSGKEGCAVAMGIGGKAKCSLGGWITVCEWKEDKSYEWHRVDMKTAKVDGKKIKADTWYSLKGGKFVEVKE